MRTLRGLPLLSTLIVTLVSIADATGMREDYENQNIVADNIAQVIDSTLEDYGDQKFLMDDGCKDSRYKIHLFSSSPLVIYIENFLHPDEQLHLLDITKGTFSSSAVADESGTEGLRSTRSSQSTRVPRNSITRCIERRALSIQGFDITPKQTESLQLVQYATGGKYHWHTDWFTSPTQATPSMGGNRLSSFFVYVSAQNVTGGGTNFPMLDPPRDEKWCEFVDCDEELERGVTFRPREGNAVFWRNLVEDGKGAWKGDERTLHAGLPVERGVKVGMNIWTREGDMGEEYRGVD